MNHAAIELQRSQRGFSWTHPDVITPGRVHDFGALSGSTMSAMTGIQQRTITTGTHGHYLVKNPERTPRALLVGFHGYGESAEQSMAAMLRIEASRKCFLAAIQGLHLFYRGRGEEVVASWMTRLGREDAIADNIQYVQSVVGRIREELPPLPVIFIGFSQGAAMAYRAAVAVGTSDGIIALGGDIPPDVNAALLPRVLIGRGADDTWYTEPKMNEDLRRLDEAGVNVAQCVFTGGHEWTEPFLLLASEFIETIIDPLR